MLRFCSRLLLYQLTSVRLNRAPGTREKKDDLDMIPATAQRGQVSYTFPDKAALKVLEARCTPRLEGRGEGVIYSGWG